MGIWNKIGKIALTAAPYVAAPFTGGMSLYAAPATNALAKKWEQSDAQKAMAKGIAPSSFDKYLGMAGDIAGMATPALAGGGAFGKASSAFGGSKAAQIGNIANAGMGIMGAISATKGPNTNAGSPDYAGASQVGPASLYPPNEGDASRGIGPTMPRGGYRFNQNPLNQLDQSNPNLSQALFQGRQEAIRNQPFRKGYDVTTWQHSDPNNLDSDLVKTTRRTSPIYPTGGRRGGY